MHQISFFKPTNTDLADGLNNTYPLNYSAEPEIRLEIQDGVGVRVATKQIEHTVDDVLTPDMTRADFNHIFSENEYEDFQAEFEASINIYILDSVITLSDPNYTSRSFNFSVNPILFNSRKHNSPKDLLATFFPRIEDSFNLEKINLIYSAIGMPQKDLDFRMQIIRQIAYKIGSTLNPCDNKFLITQKVIQNSRADILFRIEQFIEAVNQIQLEFGNIEQIKIIEKPRTINLRIPREVYVPSFMWLNSRNPEFISLQTSAEFENGILIRTESGQDIFVDLWPKKSFANRTAGQQLAEFTRWLVLNGHLHCDCESITNYVNNQYFLSSLANLNILRFLRDGSFELIKPIDLFWSSLEKLAKVTEVALMKKRTFKNMFPKKEKVAKEA